MWKRWLVIVLAVVMWTSPAATAPPPEAEAAARRGHDSPGPGYQVMIWNPKERLAKPYGNHWVFYVGEPDRPYLEMLVANTPDKGWMAVSWAQLGTGHYLPASEALATAAAQGLVPDGEPRLCLFGSFQFWLLEAGGQAYFYPTTSVMPEYMGMARHKLTPVEPLVRKVYRWAYLADWLEVLPVLIGAGLLLVGLAVWRKRRLV